MVKVLSEVISKLYIILKAANERIKKKRHLDGRIKIFILKYEEERAKRLLRIA